VLRLQRVLAHCLPHMHVTCDGFEVETLINVRLLGRLAVTEVPSVESSDPRESKLTRPGWMRSAHDPSRARRRLGRQQRRVAPSFRSCAPAAATARDAADFAKRQRGRFDPKCPSASTQAGLRHGSVADDAASEPSAAGPVAQSANAPGRPADHVVLRPRSAPERDISPMAAGRHRPRVDRRR